MKKAFSIILVLALCISLATTAFAATPEAVMAADKLNEFGLFNGVGNNADGTPNYDLDRAPNRMEAVTLLVRLLGKEAAAQNGKLATPFTDVADWAKPYVGYAYENGLTSGTSATTFSGTETVSATQYLTFVLRALGYSSDSDFAWDAAWELTDELGITNGEYDATSAFTRGDAVIISAAAIDVTLKDGSKTLLEAIVENLAEVVEPQPEPDPQPEPESKPASEYLYEAYIEENYRRSTDKLPSHDFHAEVHMGVISATKVVFEATFVASIDTTSDITSEGTSFYGFDPNSDGFVRISVYESYVYIQYYPMDGVFSAINVNYDEPIDWYEMAGGSFDCVTNADGSVFITFELSDWLDEPYDLLTFKGFDFFAASSAEARARLFDIYN